MIPVQLFGLSLLLHSQVSFVSQTAPTRVEGQAPASAVVVGLTAASLSRGVGLAGACCLLLARSCPPLLGGCFGVCVCVCACVWVCGCVCVGVWLQACGCAGCFPSFFPCSRRFLGSRREFCDCGWVSVSCQACSCRHDQEPRTKNRQARTPNQENTDKQHTNKKK